MLWSTGGFPKQGLPLWWVDLSFPSAVGSSWAMDGIWLAPRNRIKLLLAPSTPPDSVNIGLSTKRRQEKPANPQAPRKKPDDGRMKGLAFALDPDGYWVEILRGGGDTPTLAQTMLRDFRQGEMGRANLAWSVEFCPNKYDLCVSVSSPQAGKSNKEPKNHPQKILLQSFARASADPIVVTGE